MPPQCTLALAISVLTFGLVAIHLAGGDPAELRRTVEAVKPLIMDAVAAPAPASSSSPTPSPTPAAMLGFPASDGRGANDGYVGVR